MVKPRVGTHVPDARGVEKREILVLNFSHGVVSSDSKVGNSGTG